MKRRIVSLILAGAVCFSFAACGKDEPKVPETAEEALEQAQSAWQTVTDEAAKKKEAAKKEFEDNQKKISDVSVEVPENGKIDFKSYAIVDSLIGDGSKVIVFTMDFTSLNPERNTSFYHIINSIKLYQDGAEIPMSTSEFDKDLSTEIKNGAKIEIIGSYKLRNDTSDIEVEYTPSEFSRISENLLNGDTPAEPETVTQVIKLKK